MLWGSIGPWQCMPFCFFFFSKTLTFDIHQTSQHSPEGNSTVLSCTVLYCTALYHTVLYCTVLCCTALHCTALHCTALYCTLLYFTVLYCTLLYFTVLFCTLLYFTVLYCTALYCTLLYCTVLYCTVLYCTVLYCTILEVPTKGFFFNTTFDILNWSRAQALQLINQQKSFMTLQNHCDQTLFFRNVSIQLEVACTVTDFLTWQGAFLLLPFLPILFNWWTISNLFINKINDPLYLSFIAWENPDQLECIGRHSGCFYPQSLEVEP